MKDLELISGDFFDLEIPKEKKFLLIYFKTPLQVAFLRYFLVFGKSRNFTNHTGYYCSVKSARNLQTRYTKLITLYENAKKEMSIENMKTIHLIESGKYILTKGGF